MELGEEPYDPQWGHSGLREVRQKETHGKARCCPPGRLYCDFGKSFFPPPSLPHASRHNKSEEPRGTAS